MRRGTAAGGAVLPQKNKEISTPGPPPDPTGTLINPELKSTSKEYMGPGCDESFRFSRNERARIEATGKAILQPGTYNSVDVVAVDEEWPGTPWLRR